MSLSSHIKINLGNSENFSFYYCYNQNTTFEDLLEFILYNFPEKNLCPCTKFVDPNNKDKASIHYINNDSKVSEFFKNNINIFQINKSSEHKIYCEFKNHFKNSKTEVIKYFVHLEKEYKSKLDDSTKIMLDYENQIKDLKSKLEDKENLIKEEIKKKYENEITQLKKENSILKLSINGDIEKINQLKNFGINENFKKKDNIIEIDPNSNQIVVNNDDVNEKNLNDFYDVIIGITSIKDIISGWKIKKSKKAEEKYNSLKKEKIIKIGVIGNSNKGKSFILSKLSKIELPSGSSIRTEGLSIKYPELDIFKDRKIALLDSAGLETPVLKEEKEIDLEKDEKKEQEELKENNENENVINENENNKISVKEFFREKSREKLITELFLQSYIIINSDILIIVVGILTYSEQKLLNRIKTDIQRAKMKKPIYIIHNLITYSTKKQVKEYINNFLLKSATFDLEEGHKISSKIESLNGIYYYEKNMDPKIYHLIFANEGSEAGKFYNQFTLNFMESEYQRVTDLNPFDAIETIKKRFVEISKEIFEQIENPISLKDFNDSNDKSIKLQNIEKLTLKKCLIDELGFSYLKVNGFEPTYNYYKEENKLIIRVEAPGNSIIKTEINYSGEYTIIRIIGTKKKDKKPEKSEDNIFNSREIGNFSFDVPLKSEDFLIKNEPPSYTEKKGIFIIEFKLDEKFKDKGYGQEEEEI